MDLCPICKMPTAFKNQTSDTYTYEISCFRCGKYKTTDDIRYNVINFNINEVQRNIISAWIREHQLSFISTDDIDKLKEIKPPNVDEKAAKLIKFMSDVYPIAGQRGGVYFEAGLALGLNMPVIWICEEELKSNEIHFDTRQYNYLTWKESAIGDLKEPLQNRIEAIIGKGSYSPS